MEFGLDQSSCRLLVYCHSIIYNPIHDVNINAVARVPVPAPQFRCYTIVPASPYNTVLDFIVGGSGYETKLSYVWCVCVCTCVSTIRRQRVSWGVTDGQEIYILCP